MGKKKKQSQITKQKSNDDDLHMGFVEYFLDELVKDYKTNKADTFGFATAEAKEESLQINEFVLKGYLKMLQNVSIVPFIQRPQFLELCNILQFNFKSQERGMNLLDSIKKELEFLNNEEKNKPLKPNHRSIIVSEQRNALIQSFETIIDQLSFYSHMLQNVERPWSSTPLTTTDKDEPAPSGVSKTRIESQQETTQVHVAGAADFQLSIIETTLKDPFPLNARTDEVHDVEVYNVKIQRISGDKGRLNLSNKKEAWVDVSIEKISDEDWCSQYKRNLEITRGHPHIIRLEYLLYKSDDKVEFLVERYNSTLGELITKSSFTEMWKKVGLDTYHCAWRFSHFFQNILRNILEGLIFLLENKVGYEISLQSVVFLENDTKREKPKLTHIYIHNGECSAKKMFGYLKLMIDQIIKEHQKNGLGDVHEDVVHFLKMLEDFREGAQIFLKHPALWRSPEKLNFIVRVRNYVRYGKVKFNWMLRNSFIKEYPSWIDMVETHEYLDKRLQYGNKLKKDRGEKGEAYNRSLYSLVNFIRDNFEHINEEMKMSDGKIECEDARQIVMEESEKWTWEGLDELFETVFPKLACLLYWDLASFM